MKSTKGYLALVSGTILIGLIVMMTMGLFSRDESRRGDSFEKVTVSRRDIRSSVLATGIIKPMVGAEVRVGSRVSGIVKQLYVNIGDQVKKGDLLAQLDPTEFEARYNQSLAAVENVTANLEYTRLDFTRQHQLSQKKYISKDELDIAERAFRIAQSQLKQTEANLAYDRIQLEYTQIRAPISGVVASVSTQEGETVAASFSAPTFLTIIDLQRLEVWAYVDETDIGRISAGQQASFTVDTYADTNFEGTVTAIYPKAEVQDNVVNYITIIDMTGTQGRILRPEMTTTVNIYLETRRNALTVPSKGVRRESGRRFVYLLENNQPVKRWVKVGWKDDLYIQVIDGLSEQDQIIVGEVDLN